MNFQKKIESNIMGNTIDPGLDINNLINSTQPLDYIIKLLIIQKREDLHYALDSYIKSKALGQSGDLSKLRARIVSLFFGLRATLKNYYALLKREKDFEKLEKDILSAKDFETLYNICGDLEDFLYLKGVIKFDILKNIPGSDLEGHNKSHGYL
jgi:hypothetical protein